MTHSTHSTQLTLISPVLLRIAGLPMDVLDGQRATAIVYRIGQYRLQLDRLTFLKHSLLEQVFAVIQRSPSGRPQQRLQELRRDLYNDRSVRDEDAAEARRWLPEPLGDSLANFIREQQRLARYYRTTALLYRQQVRQCRCQFQQTIGHETFQRGLAFSSLSLLRQLSRYQNTHPAKFRKDDFQTENGLLRYLTRATTKTTPYSTFTPVATAPLGLQPTEPWQSKKLRSTVSLSVRLLGVFMAFVQSNRRLHEQWPVALNPSVIASADSLRYVRQRAGEVACARLPLSAALRWVAGQTTQQGHYTDWVERIRNRFRTPTMQGRQYIDKLIELGLLERHAPASAADPDWSLTLRTWLHRHRWMAPAFVDQQLQLLNGLLDTARTLSTATASQRGILLTKVHALLTERVARMTHPPTTDFWPLRPEQLFFEDTARPLRGQLPQADMQTLVALTNRLTNHVATVCTTPAHPLASLFKQAYDPGERVPLTLFFEHYLQQSTPPVATAVRPPTDWRHRWEAWAAEGRRGQTVHLRSEWLPNEPGRVRSQGFFWQSWTNDRGQLCAALNQPAGGFGRMYGRFLPYVDPTLTHRIAQANQSVVEGFLLAEATDDHYHNANFHPALVDTIIATPSGHRPAGFSAPLHLKELSVGLSDDGQRLNLWHGPTNRRVLVPDLGFQNQRSKLYTFLRQFGPATDGGVLPLCSVINEWFTGQEPVSEVIIWPRIVLDGRLVVQRQSWWLPVGAQTDLTADKDAFVFFDRVQTWKARYQLPDEVFVSLPDAPATDDRKPQYMRFDDPLLVDLLRRLVRKTTGGTGRLRITEMRPASDELTRINGRPYAVEAVPQWYAPEPVVPVPVPGTVARSRSSAITI